MTNTQRFIELAIEGGWNEAEYAFAGQGASNDVEVNGWLYTIEEVLLDPLAWQAVGKVKWNKWQGCLDHAAVWRCKWDGFFFLLADGKSIEEALGEILSTQ